MRKGTITVASTGLKKNMLFNNLEMPWKVPEGKIYIKG